MQKRQKPVNKSDLPDDVIQSLAEILYPLMVKYYEAQELKSEEADLAGDEIPPEQ